MAERGAGTSPASASEPPSPATVSESGDVEAIGKPLAQCAGQRAAHLHVVGKIEIVGSHRCNDAFPDSVREIDAHDDADTQDQRKVVRDICAKSQIWVLAQKHQHAIRATWFAVRRSDSKRTSPKRIPDTHNRHSTAL